MQDNKIIEITTQQTRYVGKENKNKEMYNKLFGKKDLKMKKEIWFNFKEVIFINSYDENYSYKSLANSMYVVIVKKDYQFRIPLKYCNYKQKGKFVWNVLEENEYWVYNHKTKTNEKLLGKDIVPLFNVNKENK